MATYKAQRSKTREPTHPGEMLPEIIIELNISATQFAKDIQISRALLYKIINKEKSITPATALKLGKYLGNGPNLWLNMQKTHDLWVAEIELKDVLKQIPKRHMAA